MMLERIRTWRIFPVFLMSKANLENSNPDKGGASLSAEIIDDMIIIHILLTIVFYLVLLWLSINLLGLLVRGFFANPELNKLKAEAKHDFIKEEIKKSESADKWINLVAFLSIIGYLYAAFHFWNIGVAIVAIVLMLVRLPTLLWEIKTGQELNRVASALSIPKNNLQYISTLLTLAALPALYYFLYYF